MSTNQSTKEIVYRQIADVPGHRFGSDGTAWSRHLVGSIGLGDQWSLVGGHADRRKSGRIWIYIRVNGDQLHIRLDEALCWAFYGRRPQGKECIHKDDDLSNNEIGNLCWGNRPEDIRDMSLDYRTLPNLDGYLFCEDGNIWSFWSTGYKDKTDVCRRLKQTLLPSYHLQVSLKWRGGKDRRFGVHRLICMAFHGEPPTEHECRHLDGDPQNNRADNLTWGTKQENANDAIRTRSLSHGETHPSSKLTEEKVKKIREAYDGGVTKAELARQYGVTHRSITGIVNGETWKHLYDGDRESVISNFAKLPSIYTVECHTESMPWDLIGTWVVRSGDYIVIFDGPVAESRAREYAQWKNSQ